MTINWHQFVTSNFWFGVDRVNIHTIDRAIFYAGAAAVVLGIIFLVSRFLIKNKFLKRVAAQFSVLFIVMGLAEVAWYAMRTQYVATLSTRFVAALIAVIGLIWLYHPVKYLLRRYKVDMAEVQRQQLKEKYLNR